MENSKEIKKEIRFLLKIGSPIVATQLLSMALNVVDTIMAGNLSAADLAGVAIGNSIYLPIAIFCMATLIAVNPIVSQHLGARRFDEIGKNARQMFWLAAILAIPAFFMIRNVGIIMDWIGVTAEIIPLASGYLDAISWGIFPLLIYSGLRYFSEGLSLTRPAMYIAGASIFVNIGANYVLMYGKLGFPALGAIGTGYATSVVHFFAAAAFLFFISSFKPFKRFNIFERTRGPEMKYIRELLDVGIPNGASSTMEVLLFASVSILMGTLSTQAAAAHQIAINIAATIFMIPFGLSMAVTQRVGFSIGQGSLSKARFRGFTGIAICTGIMCITAVILFSIPEVIVSIYTDTPEVAGMAVSLLFMAAVFQISDGLQVGGFGALRGLKDTKIPMVVNFFSYWLIGFTTGYLLGFEFGYGPQGLWIGLIAGLSVAALLHNIRFHILTKE